MPHLEKTLIRGDTQKLRIKSDRPIPDNLATIPLSIRRAISSTEPEILIRRHQAVCTPGGPVGDPVPPVVAPGGWVPP
jgi:hypothetical protein